MRREQASRGRAMVVSFNRYLPVILPEIEDSELGRVARVEPLDGKQRASYVTDETVARDSSTTICSGCPTTTTTTTTAAASVTTPAVTVPLCVLGEVQLRFLCPDDLEEVRSLCQDWFPIGEPTHTHTPGTKRSCLICKCNTGLKKIFSYNSFI